MQNKLVKVQTKNKKEKKMSLKIMKFMEKQ